MSEFSLGKNGKFGSIDFNKLKSGITAAQLGIKDGVLKSIFDKIDTTKDGSLDRSELQEFIRQVEELAQKDKKDNNLSLNEARNFQLDDKNIGKNKDELLNFLSKLAGLTKGIKQVTEGTNTENPSEIIEYENGKTEEIFKDGSKIITIKDGNKTTTTKYDEKGNQTEETVVDGDNVTITTFTNNKKSVSTTVNQASGKITEITYDENEEAKKKIEKEKNGTEKEFELNGETEVLKREKTETGETVFDGDKKTITTEENGKKITTVYEGETLKTTETSYKNDENKTIVEKTTHNSQNKTTNISVDGVDKYQQKVIDGKEYFVEYDENGNTVGIIVQNGEGINAIAKKFGCTAQELIKANGSKVKGKYPNAYFLVGAEIKIPKKLEADHKALQGRKTRDEAIQGYKDFMAAKKAEEEARLAAEAAEAARIAEEARLAQEAQNNTTIQKESAKQIVADLKDAIKGLNDNDKIKEVLSRIDDPEEFKEVERLLAGEGYEADELYSVLEKFMYKELSESKISDNSFELLEQTVQKWIQSGVLKGDDAINAQARLAARIICDGGDGFGTDPDEIKRGIALIKSPTNNPADAKKVYAKVNDIIKNHKTFYGMGAESKDLVDYLKGELFDKEIIEHLGKLAENDALQGDERVEATANLVEAAVKGGGTREGRLTQAIKGVKTPEERAKLEAKLNEYCEQRGIERQYDGQSSIQAILYDECSHSEVRKYNEMMIAQGAYTTDEAVNLRAEQAMLQILEGNFGNIEEAVKEIKDPAVLAKLNTLIATQGFADLNDFLAKNLNETQANLINAELASKSLLSDEKSAEVALKLIQSTDFNQKAMGLKSIRNENTAKLVDTKLKESGSSLAKVYEQFNAEKATNKTLAAIWDGIAIFTGFISEGISDEYARNINMSDNLYVESQTKTDIPADKQAAYDLAVQDFAFRLEELKTSYESALDSQGLVSGLINSIASRFNVGTTRDEIEARIAYDTESLRLFELAKEGKLAKIVDGKPVAVSFEEIFKERQSGRISANLVKISTAKSADEITEFNAEKMTAVATQTQRMAVMSELKDLVFTSWQDLEEGIYSGDTKRLAVGIHNTLKMLSELKGEKMSLDQYGYSLNSEGIIVDQSGNPVDALKLRTVAMQLKQGLADIAKATFGVEINTNTDKNALKELLDKTFEEKIEAFKQEYEEAYGQRPTDEMVEKYIKTINTGKTALNVVAAIGAALLVPFTGGGSLVGFLGVSATTATAIVSGVAVAGTSMGLNALEKSTDADGYTNLEWTSDAEQALWDGVLTAVGMKVGGVAEKFAQGAIQTGTLGKLSAKTSEILAKSIKNPATLNKVTTIVARAEALGFEVSSDALQSLVQMYCQEGEFNAEIFTRALVMSAIGNAAGHISAAAKDVKAAGVNPSTEPQPTRISRGVKGDVNNHRDFIADGEVARNIDQSHLDANGRKMVEEGLEDVPTPEELARYQKENAYQPVPEADVPAYQKHQAQVAADYADAHRVGNNSVVTTPKTPKETKKAIDKLNDEIRGIDGSIKRLERRIAGAKRFGRNTDTLEKQLEALQQKRGVKAAELEALQNPPKVEVEATTTPKADVEEVVTLLKKTTNNAQNQSVTSDIDVNNVRNIAKDFAESEYTIYYKGKKTKSYDNAKPRVIYQNAINLKYENLRHASYPDSPRYNENVISYLEAESSSMYGKNENNWIFRIPKNKQNWPEHSIDRISLNIYPDMELMQKLDKYFSSGKVKGYYKIPEQIGLSRFRHDPLTIYLHEPINQTIIGDIVELSASHVRSADNVLVGKTVASGVAIDKSPTEATLKALIEEAKIYDIELANYLTGFFTDVFNPPAMKSSAGYVAAVRELLDEIKKVYNNKNLI